MRVVDMLLQKHDLVEISFRAERHHTKYAIDKHWISLLTSAVARPEGEERMDTNVNTRPGHNKQDYWTGQTCHNDDSR